MNKFALVIVSVCTLLISACAISPQSIPLNPSVTVKAQNIGMGRSMNLKVVDTRPDPVLGSRGGIYAKTAVLTIEGGVEEPIRQEVAGALSAYGFSVVDVMNSDLTMRVEVETLDYEKTGKKFPMMIKNHILIKAICEKNGEEFTSRYSANRSKEYVATPSEKQNEAMINELVSKALNAMLSDPRLITFLK